MNLAEKGALIQCLINESVSRSGRKYTLEKPPHSEI